MSIILVLAPAIPCWSILLLPWSQMSEKKTIAIWANAPNSRTDRQPFRW